MKFLFLLLFYTAGIFAQDTRWIDIEWEEVPEAKEYQIELFQEVQGQNVPRGKYKTDSAAWSNAVQPGKYSLRLRSVDNRGVPGEWSEIIPLKVRMKNPLMLRPVASDKITEPLIEFEWAPVPGAHQYQLVVRNQQKEIIHNAVTTELKTSVYVENLGQIQWAVFALEKDEEAKGQDQWKDPYFRMFNRVPGVLEAPKVYLDLTDKVKLSWDRVKLAQAYEIDYLPPPDAGEKNRRFRVKLSPLSFAAMRLKDGVTTLTIKSMAPGHKDSKKSIVKIYKSGSNVELQDVIQGHDREEVKISPSKTFFKDDLLLSVVLSRYTYESEDRETDTRLSQKSLTGLGFAGEWNRRPALNSLNRKFEFSFLHLSSGIDSGIYSRVAYSYQKDKKFSGSTFNYGAGASALVLPSFQGNRFRNKVSVNSSTSIGPEFHLGLTKPLGQLWLLQGMATFAYHPLFISSDVDGAKAFLWMKFMGRAQYFLQKSRRSSQKSVIRPGLRNGLKVLRRYQVLV